MYFPDFEKFKELAQKGNMIPVYREIMADLKTPVSVLAKLRTKEYAFLLESVEGGEKWGRYTFLGTDPSLTFRIRGENVLLERNGQQESKPHNGRPFELLRNIMQSYRPVAVQGLPRFSGGAVGFMGYESVRFFERLPETKANVTGTDEAVFLITPALIIFDNIRHTIKVVSNVSCEEAESEESLRHKYEEAVKTIDGLVNDIRTTPEEIPLSALREETTGLNSNMTPAEFKDIVQKAKEYIYAGDIIQVVLSQRFEGECDIDPFHLYRALRFINPSPYLFYLKLRDTFLIGSSPEVMVRLEEGMVELKPIAGTRKRGATEQEDRALADELLQDPKEKAEHVMLVDLGRNDLGRIARTGSVRVNQLMAVERYSHVMHLVSNVQALLAPGKDAFDALKAAFPAGTLSGAPKIRAMEIINELEPSQRGPYGGAVGYLSFTGNMDFCITIRTMIVKNGRIYIQAGAGIVADSDPQAEYVETVNKAQGMLQAVRLAAAGLEIDAIKPATIKTGTQN